MTTLRGRRVRGRLAAVLVVLLVVAAGGLARRWGGGTDGGAPAARGAHGARVDRVVDGDTIRLAGVGSVRLIGIDTPEVYGGVECYGREASAFTKRELPPGSRVRYRVGTEPRDRYGRTLAYVWLADGTFLNALLVERGYATPLTIPPNDDRAREFLAAARRARERHLGLWNDATCGGINRPR
jgi:micrococcal nuclease